MQWPGTETYSRYVRLDHAPVVKLIFPGIYRRIHFTFNFIEFAIVMTLQDTVALLGALSELRRKENVSGNSISRLLCSSSLMWRSILLAFFWIKLDIWLCSSTGPLDKVPSWENVFQSVWKNTCFRACFFNVPVRKLILNWVLHLVRLQAMVPSPFLSKTEMKSLKLHRSAVTPHFVLAWESFLSLCTSLVEATFTTTTASVVEKGIWGWDPKVWKGEASSEGTDITLTGCATKSRTYGWNKDGACGDMSAISMVWEDIFGGSIAKVTKTRKFFSGEANPSNWSEPSTSSWKNWFISI